MPQSQPSTPTMTNSGGRLVVAIDGPAGAGKSTVARMLADRLGYDLLDTGAIYRTLALLSSRQGVSWDDGARVSGLAEGLDIRFRLQEGVNRVVVNGTDVTGDIRSSEISDGASRVSALPEVRAALLELQRRLGAAGGVVVEGRDIGTVVFPNAEAKFFLTATVDERARRRTAELRASGRATDEQAVLMDIVARDLRDTTRPVAPLRAATDAVEIDSSAMNADQVVQRMFDVVQQRAAASTPHLDQNDTGRRT
ncbi:MAG: (d)CMP kinase [Myxococcales bacterium]